MPALVKTSPRRPTRDSTASRDGFSTNRWPQPCASATSTPYLPATSSASRRTEAIVTIAPLVRCASIMSARSKSNSESVGNTSAGPCRSQRSRWRRVASPDPTLPWSCRLRVYRTLICRDSPYSRTALIWHRFARQPDLPVDQRPAEHVHGGLAARVALRGQGQWPGSQAQPARQCDADDAGRPPVHGGGAAVAVPGGTRSVRRQRLGGHPYSGSRSANDTLCSRSTFSMLRRTSSLGETSTIRTSPPIFCRQKVRPRRPAEEMDSSLLISSTSRSRSAAEACSILSWKIGAALSSSAPSIVITAVRPCWVSEAVKVIACS